MAGGYRLILLGQLKHHQHQYQHLLAVDPVLVFGLSSTLCTSSSRSSSSISSWSCWLYKRFWCKGGLLWHYYKSSYWTSILCKRWYGRSIDPDPEGSALSCSYRKGGLWVRLVRLVQQSSSEQQLPQETTGSIWPGSRSTISIRSSRWLSRLSRWLCRCWPICLVPIICTFWA